MAPRTTAFGFSVSNLLIYLLIAAATGGLLIWDMRQIDRNIDSVARERGASIFQLIELTRDWNSQHGGVYVRRSEGNPPNPYLVHPRRDLVTTEGVELTMVNPAYMTRQMAELADKLEGTHFHITSLKPIRPANMADAWETESLARFETGLKERLELVDGAPPTYRYMAPLIVKPACMKCHAVQGYQVGQIRGGISVSMDARRLIEVRDDHHQTIAGIYLAAFAIFSAMTFLLTRRTRDYMRRLREANETQEATIAARTADLAREVEERQKDLDHLAESEARYRAVVEQGTEGIFVIEDDQVAFCNQRAATLLGRSVEEVVGTEMLGHVHADDLDAMRTRRDARRQGLPAPTHYRVRLRHRDIRRVVYADFDVTVLPPVQGVRHRLIINATDVTGQLAAEREQQIAAAVFDSAAEAVMVTDGDGAILRVNPAFTAITGYTPREAIGQTPRLLRSGRHDKEFFQQMWDQLQSVGRWEGEIWNRRKNGEIYIEWLAITRIAGGEQKGGYVATFTDITKRKEAEEIMRHKAHHDALTNLPNRLLFVDRLQSAFSLARRYQRVFALVFVDLDRFKEVNDTLGHGAGDALLVDASRRLIKAVRDSDTVARLGGDEFALILTEIRNQGEAEEICQRALELLRQPFLLGEGTANVSGSFGIAMFPEHGADADALQRHADMALYAVKESGRNAVRTYSPDMATARSQQGDLL